jgi:hypothetical protein
MTTVRIKGHRFTYAKEAARTPAARRKLAADMDEAQRKLAGRKLPPAAELVRAGRKLG